MELTQQWLNERSKAYEKQAENIQHQLKNGRHQVENRNVQAKCGKIDSNLNNRDRVTYHPTPSGTIEQRVNVGPPSAMEKVHAEINKKKIRDPFEQKIKYEQAKITLGLKETEQSTIEGKANKELFGRRVGIRQDRDTVTRYEAGQKKAEEKKKSQQEKRDRLQGADKLSSKVGKVEKAFNQENEVNRVTIDHHNQKWTYEQYGHAERFFIVGKKGDKLATINKVNPKKSFEAQNNASLSFKGRSPNKFRVGDLESQLVYASVQTKDLQNEEAKTLAYEKLKEDFSKARAKGKAKGEFDKSNPTAKSELPSKNGYPKDTSPAPKPEPPNKPDKEPDSGPSYDPGKADTSRTNDEKPSRVDRLASMLSGFWKGQSPSKSKSNDKGIEPS